MCIYTSTTSRLYLWLLMARMEMVCDLKYWPFFKNKASVLSIKEQKTNRVLFSL